MYRIPAQAALRLHRDGPFDGMVHDAAAQTTDLPRALGWHLTHSGAFSGISNYTDARVIPYHRPRGHRNSQSDRNVPEER